MLLFNLENISIEDYRKYCKEVCLIKKVKKTTLIKQLNIKKKEIKGGNYYKAINQNSSIQEKIFSKDFFINCEIPFAKKVSLNLLIKKGSYTLKN